MNDTMAATEPTTTPRKWTSTAGPIQTKRVNDAFRAVTRLHNEYIEINGIVEKPETHERHGYYMVFGAGNREDVTKAVADIAERFDYTVTRENCGEVVAAFNAARVELEKTPQIVDKRITQAEHDERARKNAEYEAQRKAEDAKREAEKLANPLGTVAYNSAHNGVEIAFTEKPNDSLRWSLKRAGFRITRRPPWRWYRKFTEDVWAEACRLAQVSTPCPKAASEQDGAAGYVEAQERAYEDAQAEAVGA